MRRRKIWLRAVCMSLMVCCLSACTLSGRRGNSDSSDSSQTQAPVSEISDSAASSADVTENSEPVRPTEQNTPTEAADNTEQNEPATAVESSDGTELPEIEISDTANQPVTRNGPQSAQSESTLTESSETAAPASGASQSEAAPGSGASQSAAAPASTASQAETTPVPEENPGNSGSFINENGDTMLPEVP